MVQTMPDSMPITSASRHEITFSETDPKRFAPTPTLAPRLASTRHLFSSPFPLTCLMPSWTLRCSYDNFIGLLSRCSVCSKLPNLIFVYCVCFISRMCSSPSHDLYAHAQSSITPSHAFIHLIWSMHTTYIHIDADDYGGPHLFLHEQQFRTYCVLFFRFAIPSSTPHHCDTQVWTLLIYHHKHCYETILSVRASHTL